MNFFNYTKHQVVPALSNINFIPAEHLRFNSKIVIDLTKNFTGVVLIKEKTFKKRLTKNKILFFNFINTANTAISQLNRIALGLTKKTGCQINEIAQTRIQQ